MYIPAEDLTSIVKITLVATHRYIHAVETDQRWKQRCRLSLVSSKMWKLERSTQIRVYKFSTDDEKVNVDFITTDDSHHADIQRVHL